MRLTPSQAQNFTTLKRRALLPTKFIDDIPLHVNGLFDGVITLLRRGGLGGVVGKSAEVYPRLTDEFLSTLKQIARQRGKHTIISHSMLLTLDTLWRTPK